MSRRRKPWKYDSLHRPRGCCDWTRYSSCSDWKRDAFIGPDLGFESTALFVATDMHYDHFVVVRLEHVQT